MPKFKIAPVNFATSEVAACSISWLCEEAQDWLLNNCHVDPLPLPFAKAFLREKSFTTLIRREYITAKLVQEKISRIENFAASGHSPSVVAVLKEQTRELEAKLFEASKKQRIYEQKLGILDTKRRKAIGRHQKYRHRLSTQRNIARKSKTISALCGLRYSSADHFIDSLYKRATRLDLSLAGRISLYSLRTFFRARHVLLTLRKKSKL